MTDRTDTAPLASPRDIEGNPSSTFVRCPDCNAAVFNLRNQRQAHLQWHDDLDADVASAQEAAQAAAAAADAAEQALGAAREELGEALRRDLGERPAAVPLIGDWPADEIATRVAGPTPTVPDATEGEPAETGADDLDDPDAVDLPARRF